MTTVPAALTDRTEAQRWTEVRDEDALWGDLRPELLEAVRRILEATMEDELGAELLATRYERTPWRTDLRNGSYHRTLVTELGAITDLAVPRRRLVPYRPSFLRRAARRTSTIDVVLRQAFLRGLSTRETAALATTLTGVSLSAASVSRLAAQLDAQMAAWHRRPITLRARYLLVDGLWVSVRAGHRRAGRRVILAAYGIDEAGRRELLDYRQAAAESSAEWRRLLTSLVERGLDPDQVLLVTADGADGIAAAAAEASPSSAAGPIASGTYSTRSPGPSGDPACAACGPSTGLGPGGRRRPRTGAGRGPGGHGTRASCATSSAISRACSPCSRCPSRSGPACARPT